ncbi:MAG TPA: metalloregulator ArsR/SmtB family transcription factor [Paenalcaligenes sp.]|nr:metalloregulator ArsR/SmtB family transcription factor [Paenalcaligenes sp.]
MEKLLVVQSLAALAHEVRLSVFRLLVEAGTAGLPAGEIAYKLDIAASSLSFHLKELHHAGLLHRKQQGRSIFYAANYEAMNDLLFYLTENCCQGQEKCSLSPLEEQLKKTYR